MHIQTESGALKYNTSKKKSTELQVQFCIWNQCLFQKVSKYRLMQFESFQNHMTVIKFQLDEKSRIITLIHRNISSQTLILELDFQKSPSSWKLFKTASLDPPQKFLAHSRSSSLSVTGHESQHLIGSYTYQLFIS